MSDYSVSEDLKGFGEYLVETMPEMQPVEMPRLDLLKGLKALGQYRDRVFPVFDTLDISIMIEEHTKNNGGVEIAIFSEDIFGGKFRNKVLEESRAYFELKNYLALSRYRAYYPRIFVKDTTIVMVGVLEGLPMPRRPGRVMAYVSNSPCFRKLFKHK